MKIYSDKFRKLLDNGLTWPEMLRFAKIVKENPEFRLCRTKAEALKCSERIQYKQTMAELED